MMAAASSTAAIFDPEGFRHLGQRSFCVRAVDHPVLVLGSRQRDLDLDVDAIASMNVEVVRRRSGGGAVLLGVGDHLWVDWWIPAADALWRSEAVAAAVVIGEIWAGLLDRLGIEDVAIHRSRPQTGAWAELACFAGRGPGEVFVAGRKVMGLSQWRSRSGALFQTSAYRRVDGTGLSSLFALSETEHQILANELRRDAVGLDDLGEGLFESARSQLVATLPDPGSWLSRHDT